jgi:hypothetical protein
VRTAGQDFSPPLDAGCVGRGWCWFEAGIPAGRAGGLPTRGAGVRSGKVETFLKSYPMVMEELGTLRNGLLINSEKRNVVGPLIICESTSLPWRAKTFAPIWRQIARAAMAAN